MELTKQQVSLMLCSVFSFIIGLLLGITLVQYCMMNRFKDGEGNSLSIDEVEYIVKSNYVILDSNSVKE